MNDDRAQSRPVLSGLTSEEAQRRFERFGPNQTPEEPRRPLREFLDKLWGPVPWMLEATMVLQIGLAKYDEVVVIGALLLLNAFVGFSQEQRAGRALALLREQLHVQARVLRDAVWGLQPAEALVPGDIVRVRMGDLVPADLRLLEGEVQLDQSVLTGETGPVDASAGQQVYAGAVVRHGEATGEVSATGTQTYFGKTAELVRSARTQSHTATLILRMVRYLMVFDVALVVAVLVHAARMGTALAEIAPFALMLLVASVPVALPAVFTLAAALGARELAEKGVLVARLGAIDEAAAMDVLASDKTGTLTQNRMAVAAIHAYPEFSEDEVLRLAALASDEASQDPLDLAVLSEAVRRALSDGNNHRVKFVPFDTASKRSEAIVERDGQSVRVVKGAPPSVAGLCAVPAHFGEHVDELAGRGLRVIAVADGTDSLRVAGLIGLEDPPREDSAQVVSRLRELGIDVLMVTGDGASTARAIARQVGLGERVCGPEALADGMGVLGLPCDAYAGVFPEDKFHLVRALQKAGHVAGMTGDGVNDAPALRQAEVGFAVANATDVAKAAASLVLLQPGLTGILATVESSRRVFQRMHSYVLNKLVKTFQVATFLALGYLLTGSFVVRPLFIVLLLFANDFVTMALATDRTGFSPRPDTWQMRQLVVTASMVALPLVLFCFAAFFYARDTLALPFKQVQTLMFLALVFTGQATIYLARERGHFWASRPSPWLLAATVSDLAAVSLLATAGILMVAVPWTLVLFLLGATGMLLVLLDAIKIAALRYV